MHEGREREREREGEREGSGTPVDQGARPRWSLGGDEGRWLHSCKHLDGAHLDL